MGVMVERWFDAHPYKCYMCEWHEDGKCEHESTPDVCKWFCRRDDWQERAYEWQRWSRQYGMEDPYDDRYDDDWQEREQVG